MISIVFRIVISLLVIAGGVSLHRPSSKLMTEILMHDSLHAPGAHSESNQSHEGHSHNCGCQSCPSKDNGPCHRIDCCKNLPLIVRSENTKTYDLELIVRAASSLELNMQGTLSLMPLNVRLPDILSEFRLKYLNDSLSQIPNAPPIKI